MLIKMTAMTQNHSHTDTQIHTCIGTSSPYGRSSVLLMAPSQAPGDGRRHDAQLRTSTDVCTPSHCATWWQTWHIHSPSLPYVCINDRILEQLNTWRVNWIFKPSLVARHTRIQTYKTLVSPALSRAVNTDERWFHISRNVFHGQD